jgi:hypothetical protein
MAAGLALMQTPDESPLFPKGAEELSLRGANDENIGRSSDLAWLRANQWAYSRLHSISPQRERCSVHSTVSARRVWTLDSSSQCQQLELLDNDSSR